MHDVPATAAEVGRIRRIMAAIGSDTPTPQYGRASEGIYVDWLVNGTGVCLWSDGVDADICAQDLDNSLLWDYDIPEPVSPDDEPIRVARELLGVMAHGVKFPAPETRLVVA